ncbi:MAG: hypothetical protein P1V97_26490, partial [Planctomycetota bacterium]|nr:hypothetical protein [Planctomycetota bacterium]
MEVYYAPFDHLFANAKVEITPGWTQMELAFREARKALAEGASVTEAKCHAKKTASFAGMMRKNLIGMLSELDLQNALGLGSLEELFASRNEMLHTTSALRYPVFFKDQ